MSSEEYLRCLIEEGKTFVRCDKSGVPDQYGKYWKMRDDLFAMLENEVEAPHDDNAAESPAP